MLPSELLQQQGRWHFDIASALIGGALAWILAVIIYSQRAAIKALADRLWAPVADWRRQMRASREEKHLRALKAALRRLLLLEPQEPTLIFRPPTFLVPAPLPTAVAQVTSAPRMVEIPYDNLLKGHPKLVVTGPQGSGRTTTLVMAAWQSSESDRETLDDLRLPIWIDLLDLAVVADAGELPADERLVRLAGAFLPGASLKWLLQHLRRGPSLILIDNWQKLSRGDRALVARWIADAQDAFPDTIWVVASGDEGYGDLVENGFVPVKLIPADGSEAVPDLMRGWQHLLGIDNAAQPPQAPPAETADVPLDDEVAIDTEGPENAPSDALDSAPTDEVNVFDVLTEAARAGASLWEMHLRIVLYLRTGELPIRPVDVVGQLIESELNAVEPGRNTEAVSESAQDIVLASLVDIAAQQRFDRRPPSDQKLRDIVEVYMPAKEKRHRRLENGVQRLLQGFSLLEHRDHVWRLRHQIWADYLTAIRCVQDERGAEMIHAHLADPTWLILTEFYAGLTNAEIMVQALVGESRRGNGRLPLFRAARWGVVAEPDQVWRKELIKVLAQDFMEPNVNEATRLNLGHALAVLAGNGARAFFLRLLHHASGSIRKAALRGLGWTGSESELTVLATALYEDDIDLVESAILALRDLGTSEATKHLNARLPETDEGTMLTIAGALAQTTEGPRALTTAADHPDLLVRRAAAHGLGQIDEPWARELLLKIAREDPEWLVRSAADTVLQAQEERADRQASVTPPPAVDELEWLMAWAARHGRGLGVGDAAMETLVRAARGGSVDAKVLSALTLAQIGREADLGVLGPLCQEEDPLVQEAAHWAIERIQRRYETYTAV